MSHHRRKIVCAKDANARRIPRPPRATHRNDGFTGTRITHREDRCQGSARCPQSTIQRELAEQATPSKTFAVKDAGRAEDADRNGQVEAGTALAEFGGREIDGHAAVGESKAGR